MTWKTALILVWVLLLGFALRLVTAKTQAYSARDYDVLSPPPFTSLDERLINVLTLGHRGLYDDVINIWLLQSLLDERAQARTADEVFRSMRRVTDLHPKIESLYMLCCFVLAQDLKRPDLCEPISLAGLKALPDSWRIPVTQGFIAFYNLHDPQKAALYYGLAASRQDAPPFLGKLAKNLIEKNQISVPEMQQTLDGLLGGAQGSKFGKYMKGTEP